MKTIGIICELNPLHNGHKYLFDTAKNKFGADYIVVVMSGDYTQRGDVSIVPKDVRTKMALMAGADAVFELPVQYATGSAEYFASGAISVLNSMGLVDNILFGTENGDIDEIVRISSILSGEPQNYKTALQDCLKNGLNYATARDKALRQVISIENENTLIGSNNILGIEYCKALMLSKSSIQPLTIQREGSSFNDENISKEGSFSSASSIRKALLENFDPIHDCSFASGNISKSKELLKDTMPQDVLDLILSEPMLNNNDNYSEYLHYKLMCSKKDGFCSYADIHRDLSDKIIKHLPEFTSISAFAKLLKSKDLTYTRISRSLLHILLGIRQDEIDMLKSRNYPVYLRLLGLKKDSSNLLSKMKKTASQPIISRLSDSYIIDDKIVYSLLEEDILTSDIYNLAYSKKGFLRQGEYQKKVVIM